MMGTASFEASTSEWGPVPVNTAWIPASSDGKYVITYNVKLVSSYIALENLLNNAELKDDRWDIYEIMPMPSGSYAYTVILSKSEWVENDRAS